MTAPARVLVVDDSATMRGLITAVLNADPDVTVVGQAADAMEARQAIKQLDPDVVTLDIEMPNMNGLEFLDKIMRLRPMPVIMVSTLTHKGAEATIAALEIGAFDCVGKPHPGDPHPFAGLVDKVKAAARSQRKFIITGKKNANTKSLKVTCNNEYLTAKYTPSPSNTLTVAAVPGATGQVLELGTVDVTLKPNAPAGSVQAKITVSTADGQMLDVPVWAYIPAITK